MDPRVVCSISSSPDIQDNSLSSVESGSWRSCQSLTQRTVNSTDEAELQGQSQTNTNSVRVLSEGESYLPTLFHQIIRRKGNDSDNYIIRYFPHFYLKAGLGNAWPSQWRERGWLILAVCLLRSWLSTLGSEEPTGSDKKGQVRSQHIRVGSSVLGYPGPVSFT